MHPGVPTSQPTCSAASLTPRRASGFVQVRIDGARRIYAIDCAPMQEVEEWIQKFRGFWAHRLDALATEVARGQRARAKTSRKRR
jgi:hypothetical protein